MRGTLPHSMAERVADLARARDRCIREVQRSAIVLLQSGHRSLFAGEDLLWRTACEGEPQIAAGTTSGVLRGREAGRRAWCPRHRALRTESARHRDQAARIARRVRDLERIEVDRILIDPHEVE